MYFLDIFIYLKYENYLQIWDIVIFFARQRTRKCEIYKGLLLHQYVFQIFIKESLSFFILPSRIRRPMQFTLRSLNAMNTS